MNELCSAKDCEDEERTKGYCNKHYQRWLKYGDPLFVLVVQTPNGKKLKWLQENVISTSIDEPCVLWPFPPDTHGYGRLVTKGKRWSAHAYAASILSGEEGCRPAGMVGRHICTEKLCVVHVQWGTQTENIHDRWRDGTDNRGERHGLHKLTKEQVIEIWVLVKTDMFDKTIAEMYSVDRKSINDIKLGKRWKHLTKDLK